MEYSVVAGVRERRYFENGESEKKKKKKKKRSLKEDMN